MKKINILFLLAAIMFWSMGVAVQAQTTYFRVIGGIPHLPVLANTAAVSSPSSGMVIYSTANSKPMLYTGSAWIDLCTAYTFTANAGYFKVVNGLPLFPVKASAYNTNSGAMYINSSSTLMVYDAGMWQPVNSLTGTLNNVGGSTYSAELRVPMLSSAPTPTGLAAGAFYINTTNKAITWYNGTAWVGLSCLPPCSAYSNAAHTAYLTFQCHNLGANTGLDPNTYVSYGDDYDADIKGYLYQWGRLSDGHQLRTSTFTDYSSYSAIPGHSYFIVSHDDPYNDWFASQNNNLWGSYGAKTEYDPCPPGYQVPSQAQWGSIFAGGTTSGAPGIATSNTWTWTGNGFMVGSALYLPAAGIRAPYILGCGSSGNYWSRSESWNASVGGYYSYILGFTSTSVQPGADYFRMAGCSVRCVKE